MKVCTSCSWESHWEWSVCPACGFRERPIETTAANGGSVRTSRRRSLSYTIAGAAVLGLFVALLVAAVRDARHAAQRVSCNCQLKQLGLALHNYHDTYGSFPPAYIAGPDGRPMHSWRVLILPYIDQVPLYQEYDFTEPWDGPNNIRLLHQRPKVFDCPSRDDPPGAGTLIVAAFGLFACSGPDPDIRSGVTTSYAAVFGPDCVFRGSDPVHLADITDGSSNTAIIGELTGAKIPWTKPEDIDVRQHPRLGDPQGFSGSGRGGGVYFSLGDGSVRSINPKTPQATIDGLFTRNGNETLGEH